MRILKLGLPLAIFVAGLLFNAPASLAKPEYTKKEKKGCVFCHVSAKGGKDNLTEAGKYYKDHNSSLVGFQAK